jgi:glyoxylase-like metal-dependent hydrolase (beta-lactamase superfamily II)
MDPPFLHWSIGTTSIIVEEKDETILIDTGLGADYYTNKSVKRKLFSAIFGIQESISNSARKQIEALGIIQNTVQQIILTHLHFDHAGGISDFPEARIHIHEKELAAIIKPKKWLDHGYDNKDILQNPKWRIYSTVNAEWKGFSAIRIEVAQEMYFIPLPGHTAGHCGVALRTEQGWIFYCGDAIPVNTEYERGNKWLNHIVLGNHIEEVQQWSKAHPEVKVVAGHMWSTYYKGKSRPTLR